jgi:hypothetical protein
MLSALLTPSTSRHVSDVALRGVRVGLSWPRSSASLLTVAAGFARGSGAAPEHPSVQSRRVAATVEAVEGTFEFQFIASVEHLFWASSRLFSGSQKGSQQPQTLGDA